MPIWWMISSGYAPIGKPTVPNPVAGGIGPTERDQKMCVGSQIPAPAPCPESAIPYNLAIGSGDRIGPADRRHGMRQTDYRNQQV